MSATHDIRVLNSPGPVSDRFMLSRAFLQIIIGPVGSAKTMTMLRKLRRKPEDLAGTGKSVDWKLAVATALKARTTVTNRWLATTLRMGNLHEVSRKVGAWARQPDPALQKKLQ